MTSESTRSALPESPEDILQHLPEGEDFTQFKKWVRSDLSTDELTVKDCVAAMRASHREIAVAGSAHGSEPEWAYYVDSEQNLRAWIPGTEIRETDEASEMLSDDLENGGINVAAVLARDQPRPVNPEPLNLGSNDDTELTSHIQEYDGDSDMITFERTNTPSQEIRIEQIGDDPDIKYRYDWNERGYPTPEQFERVSFIEVKLAVMMTDLDEELHSQAEVVLEELQRLQRMMCRTRELDDKTTGSVCMGNIDSLPEVEEL